MRIVARRGNLAGSESENRFRSIDVSDIIISLTEIRMEIMWERPLDIELERPLDRELERQSDDNVLCKCYKN